MNLILEWNSIALEAIRSIGKLPFASPDRERGGPPQVARSLGIIYSSIYDAWVAYDNVAAIAAQPGFSRSGQACHRHPGTPDPGTKVIAEYGADGPKSELPPGDWTEF